MRAALAALLLALSAASMASAPSSPGLCDREAQHSAAEQDRLLQIAGLLRAELSDADQPVALIARAGTPALARFGVRYSHAALSLRDSPIAPWGVRQLYFACDEGRARLFDQGLAGFLAGADAAEQGFVALLLLPAEAAGPLAAAALDDTTAQRLLVGDYLANAHPEDLLRLNCNQWLAELFAQAWAPAEIAPPTDRQAAQAVLAGWAYAPAPLHYGNPLWRLAVALLPWVSFAGHPPRADAALVTSLPADLERLALRLWPAARRVELCYTAEHALLRRDSEALDDRCRPAAGDQLLRFAPG